MPERNIEQYSIDGLHRWIDEEDISVADIDGAAIPAISPAVPLSKHLAIRAVSSTSGRERVASWVFWTHPNVPRPTDIEAAFTSAGGHVETTIVMIRAEVGKHQAHWLLEGGSTSRRNTEDRCISANSWSSVWQENISLKQKSRSYAAIKHVCSCRLTFLGVTCSAGITSRALQNIATTVSVLLRLSSIILPLRL
ncbi:hypothetical protein FHS19_000044 [Paenibacillus rhizosphaerae]|uniref:Uncharacterized protein n=1 Tax=Paenibacillus rhizosphaerae TaxID=297318 RepID=A0A839TI11_9BACL|nr:hypothetical protein [Paenibacillus rhizosphaerae]